MIRKFQYKIINKTIKLNTLIFFNPPIMDNFLFEVIEAPLPRKKIELDLLARHKKLQQKIDALKVLRLKEELKNNTSIPTINPTSRKIANKSLLTSSSRMTRTMQILSTSRFLPRQVSINLDSLKFDSSSNDSKPLVQSYRFTDGASPMIDLITFPSLEMNQEQFFPSDILKRNALLSSLRAEVFSRGFLKDPEEPKEASFSGIHERGLAWQQKKNARLAELRLKKEEKGLSGCTFKPEVKSPQFTVNKSLRTASSDCSYLQIFRKKQAFQGKSRSERNFSQETKACTAVHSARISIHLNSESPKYNSLCPVSFPLSISNGLRLLKRFSSKKSQRLAKALN
jgi:hypothetical protein